MGDTGQSDGLSRRRLLTGAIGAAAAAAGSPGAAGPSRRPNIVFLLADQWRASATGYAGDPNVRTPNLDRLARQSVDFRNAVSVCPICTPYRAALLTGRYPTSTGMFMNDLYLPAEEVTLAGMLKRAGYDTAYIGKWHLDGHGRDAYIPPERRQGWDTWRGSECDHDYMRSHYYEEAPRRKQFWPGYDAFAQTAEAQAYVRGRREIDRPFALLVSYGPPHFPHFPLPPGFESSYRADALTMAPNVPPGMLDRARKEAAGYYAHCEAIDRCVGSIVATLDEAGLADDTILVFTSDHGEMLGAHGVEPFRKQVPWNESAHVPFLLRYPRAHGNAARAVNTPTTTPDILPTLLGLARVPAARSVEGLDLSRLVRGGNEIDRAALSMLVVPFGLPPAVSREYRSIRTEQHTYVRALSGPWLLYNDRKDPLQMTNLVDDHASAALVKQLDARLQAELRRIGDRFAPREHYLERWGYEVGEGGHIPYGPGAKVQSPRRSTGEQR